VTLDPGSGGAVIATDDNGTAQVQWIKLQFGPDGTFTTVTASVGLPVGDAGGSLTVDAPVGTPVAVRISDGSSFIGPATAANQATEIASLASIDGKTPALGQALAAASVPVVLTAAQVSTLTPLSTVAATQSGSWTVGITGTVTFSNTTIAVTNAGTFAVQAAQSGTWTTNSHTYSGDGLTQITQTAGALDVNIHGASATINAAQSGTWNITNISGTVSLPTGASTLAEQQSQTTSLQLLDDAVGTTGAAIPTKGFVGVGTDGTNARVFKTDASGELQIDVLTMPTVTVTGTVAATQSGTWNIATLTSITNTVNTGGDVASDSVDSGNPVKVGYQARTSDPTAVANADRVNGYADALGKQVFQPYAPSSLSWQYAAPAGGILNSVEVTAKAASGAGIRNYISALQVINSNNTTGTEVVIKDGPSGTVIHRGWAQANGGGYALSFARPLQGTANTAIVIAEVTNTATQGVLVNLQGFTAAD
jgi:hypothetical protein